MENLIGKKVRGFKFESYKYKSLVFNPRMEEYLSKIGVIMERNEFGWGVKFEDGSQYTYPAEEIKQYLVGNLEKTYPVTRKQLSEIYDSVCDKWKSEINTIIDNGGRFSESFEVPQSLIWKARGEANTKQYQWIESVFGEMKTELEVGKWYKSWNDTHNGYDLSYYTGTGRDYGFHSSDCWFSEQYWIKNTMPSEWKEATPQEVEKALIEEAKRRGLVEGAFISGRTKLDNVYLKGRYQFYERVGCLCLGEIIILDAKGQWAEVIKQDKIEVGDWAYLEEHGFKRVKVESQAKALSKKGWSKVTDEQVLEVLNNYKLD